MPYCHHATLMPVSLCRWYGACTMQDACQGAGACKKGASFPFRGPGRPKGETYTLTKPIFPTRVLHPPTRFRAKIGGVFGTFPGNSSKILGAWRVKFYQASYFSYALWSIFLDRPYKRCYSTRGFQEDREQRVAPKVASVPDGTRVT